MRKSERAFDGFRMPRGPFGPGYARVKILKQVSGEESKGTGKMEEKNRFRTDNRQTKEEFLAQFEDTPEVITVRVTWTWEKGCSKFPSFGRNEDLVHIRYGQPWEADEDHPLGTAGTIYWFSRKKLFGYPYTPGFKRGECCRLRVRRCRESRNFFWLEEVLEKNVDVSKDEEIYRKALARFRERYSEPGEALIYIARNTNVSKTERGDGMAIGCAFADYSAIIDQPGGKPKMVGRSMLIPFNDRDFAENRKLRFRAGSICRVRVLKSRNDPFVFSLDRLLESDVSNEALAQAGKKALEPAVWTVEGYGDFDIAWDRFSMKACSREIRLDPADEGSSVWVYLQCDPDNCHTACRATEEFLKVCRDPESFKKQVFETVADDLSDENGMVETWDDEAGTITRQELMGRLSLGVLSFEDGGVDIMVDLDDLFTDHSYSVWRNADGSFEANGLVG